MASPLADAYLQAATAGTSPTPFRATVQPTNVIGAYQDYNQAMEQAYQAQLGQQNAMYGGLAGIAGAGITALPKLLSGGVSGVLSASDAASLASATGVGASDIGAGATWADVAPLLLGL